MQKTIAMHSIHSEKGIYHVLMHYQLPELPSTVQQHTQNIQNATAAADQHPRK